jgi:calcineurin-like phosphoesterase family protein
MNLISNNIWFTSDTHYNHNNICRGVTNWKHEDPFILEEATRDFPDLEAMNNSIVTNINNCVSSEDWLIHCGDWSFGGFDKIQEFRDQINCKNIVLILGNHDHHIQNNKNDVRKLFTHVTHYEEIGITKKSDKLQAVLCHYPIISWNNMREGAFMIHGHQHLKGDWRFGYGRRMDVGMCGSPEFRPYHIDEIAVIMEARPCRERHPREEEIF